MTNLEYWNPMVPELIVTDYEKSMNFYTKILGFSVRYERFGPTFAYIEIEKVQLMIEQLRNDSWITGEMKHPFGRGVNFQIELSDISGIYSRLKSTGYPLFREKVENWYQTGSVKSGQREFLVQDPDGYLLRFCQLLGEENT